jgi:uncharacterized Fe-S cluster protein YjdI
MIKKEYKNNDIAIIWQPSLCTHSGACFRRLPAVFRPRERPWIMMESGDTAGIKDAVEACPSGALSLKTPKPPSQMLIEGTTPDSNKVTIIVNGPAKVAGPCKITMPDGSIVEKPNGVTICRCGASANKPFCDGSHKSNGYIG